MHALRAAVPDPACWPGVLRLELAAGEDLGGDDGGDGPVDRGAEGRPPARASDELVAVLPEVFDAVGEVGGDEEPWGGGDRRRGEHDEGAGDEGFDEDDSGSSVSDGETDV